MHGNLVVRVPFAAVVIAALLLPACPASASAAHTYDKSGTVISLTRDVVLSYKIESEDNLYTMACVRTRLLQFGPPECNWNGRPLSVGDRVRFRIEGDAAYMPVNTNNEERLMVQMTETKLLPSLPSVQPGLEAAVVLGLGVTSEERSYMIPPDSQPGPSASSSSGSMAPVVAVPTTGGPPVVVIPTSPATGGVVTGVPATGGAPITAIPVTPADTSSAVSSPSATAGATTTATQWVHVLRVQTASHIYDLACGGRACWLSGRPVQTGDPLALRIEKKWAYLSSGGIFHEQRFAILSVRDLE